MECMNSEHIKKIIQNPTKLTKLPKSFLKPNFSTTTKGHICTKDILLEV